MNDNWFNIGQHSTQQKSTGNTASGYKPLNEAVALKNEVWNAEHQIHEDNLFLFVKNIFHILCNLNVLLTMIWSATFFFEHPVTFFIFRAYK